MYIKNNEVMNRLSFTILISAIGISTQAQDIASVLREIEHNNLELKAAQSSNRAEIFDLKGQNCPENMSVEYSPFFRKGVTGMASSEMVVSQEFDFPTLYAARNKAVRLQQNAMDMEYMSVRRDILLTAQLKCMELILLNRMRDIMDERTSNAEELLVLYTKRLKEGDATSIELNKIKMELMDVQTELLQNEASRQQIIMELQAMNSNKALSLDSISYPDNEITEDGLWKDAVNGDRGVMTAEAMLAVQEQEVRISRQGWLPKLSIGYRRNTEQDEASNGFMVGASLPIFSNRNKVKAAKARQTAVQQALDNERIQVESAMRTQIAELKQLKEMLRIYDNELMKQSQTLLKKSVMAGNMSLIEYYTEMDKVYQKRLTYLNIENKYHSLLATLHRNRL